MSTIFILTLNVLVLIVWFITAFLGIVEWLQTLIVVLTALLFVWGPYIFLESMSKKRPEAYRELEKKVRVVSIRSTVQRYKLQQIVDTLGQRRRKK